MKLIFRIFLSSLIALVASPAFAKPQLNVALETKKIVMEKGQEKAIKADVVGPGDTLLYTVTLKNTGDQAARKAQPESFIPKSTEYIPEAKKPKNVKLLFSIDGGKTFQAEPTITVEEDGKQVTKKAPVELYNKIKWVLDQSVEPGKAVTLTYKVKVK